MRFMRKTLNELGFTMMEILVAMVLLAAISSAAFSAFSNSVQVSQPYRNVALNIARSYLDCFYEYVRDDYYPMSGLPLSINSAVLPGSLPDTMSFYGKSFHVKFAVNPDASGGSSGVIINANAASGDVREDYRRVTMTVTW